MSGYAIVLDGDSLEAFVVGGGSVAERKVRTLLAAGARVRLVAPEVQPTLDALARDAVRLEIDRARYEASRIGDAHLVIAATNDAEVNARVAADATRLGRLVNVVDAPEQGNCVTPATHVVGDLVIAVSAGGVPGAARRIRDAIAARFDDRYARAVGELSRLRRSLLGNDGRARWQAISASLIDANFCERVERGELVDGVAQWR